MRVVWTDEARTHLFTAVPQALIKKGVMLLRNVWWVTQKTLTHPASIARGLD
jgi:hypothetical protein